MKNIHFLALVRRKYASISASLEQSLLQLNDPDDLAVLIDDLDKCPTVHHLAGLVQWLEGRQAGRVEGLRRAVYALVSCRGDDAAEQIEDRAFHCTDADELEALLIQAANLGRATSLSRN